MKKLTFLLFGFFGFISCGYVEFDDVITANNLFSSDVYKQVSAQYNNFVASPFSVEAVMALAQSGANGETGEEIRNALRLPDGSEKVEKSFKALLPTINGNEFYSLHSANKIYVDSATSLKTTYVKIARDVYQSEIEPIRFYPDTEKAAKTINKWVEDKTNNKIRELIVSSSLNEEIKMILINAIYFKGNWTQNFDLDPAKDFTKLNGEVVKTDFVKKTSRYNYHESAELNARFLEIPFSGHDASFVVILPNEKDGLGALEQQTEKLFMKPELSKAFVDVHMPKFKTETKIDFTQILKNLGVKKAFSLEEADFKGITEAGNVSINGVLQKAFFELTETGVEAAAATYIGFNIYPRADVSEEPKPIPFYADHPFIFYIRVKDIVLFIGRITEFSQ